MKGSHSLREAQLFLVLIKNKKRVKFKLLLLFGFVSPIIFKYKIFNFSLFYNDQYWAGNEKTYLVFIT